MSTTLSSISYDEDGVSTLFAVPFKFVIGADLVVTREQADGTSSVLALGSDYSVAGAGSDAGGSITRTAATSGATLQIMRRTTLVQPMHYATGDRFPAASHEAALDRQMMIAQEQKGDAQVLASRALQFPSSTTMRMALAGRFASVAADGSLVWASGTGADAGLRTDLAGAGGGKFVGFSHGEAYPDGSLGAKLKREVNIEDAPWLAASILVADKAAAVQAAIDHVSALGGGTVRLNTSVTLASSVTLRRNVTLLGPTGRADPGNPFAGHAGFFQALQSVPKLFLGGAATITHEGAGCIDSIYIVREGTPLDGTADPAAFSGTALTTGETDAVAVRNCSILGFDFAHEATGTARVIWSDVLIDCNNGPHQETSYDRNTYSSVHCYGVLQGDVGPTSSLTLRSGNAFYLGGTFNGGPTLFNCFEYGFQVGFNVACPGGYKFVACWSDGPHNAGTGRPLNADSVGIYCVSAVPGDVVAEPQFTGITVSSKGTGIVLGSDLYGTTLVIGALIFQCAVSINCSASNVTIVGAGIRSYFDAGIIFNSKAAGDSAKLIGVTFYDPQPSATAEVNCGTGDPLMIGCSLTGGNMRSVNCQPRSVARDGSGVVTIPDGRQSIRITGTGAISDILPRRPGLRATFVFAQSGLSIPSGTTLKTVGGTTVSGAAETSVTMRVDAGGTAWWEETRAMF